MLLEGAPVKAKEAVDWLVDYAGPMQRSLETVWCLATTGSASGLSERKLDEGVLANIPADVGVAMSDNPATEAARKPILQSIRSSCGVPLSEALDVQASFSAGFTITSFCKDGSIGAEYQRTMMV